jgi:hypothetical protein
LKKEKLSFLLFILRNGNLFERREQREYVIGAANPMMKTIFIPAPLVQTRPQFILLFGDIKLERFCAICRGMGTKCQM